MNPFSLLIALPGAAKFFIATLPATIKLKFSVITFGVLTIAQEIPIEVPTSSPVPAWVDLGTTAAAMGLLVYILKLVFSGGLVSKSLIEDVVQRTIHEAVPGAIAEALKHESERRKL